MTRKSRREIERALDDLAAGDRHPLAGPTCMVYRDPVTNKLYEGRGEDAAPVEDVPADAGLIVQTRTVCMPREQAEREDREILEVVNDTTGAVSVRIEPGDAVATEEAVVRRPDPRTPVIDFAEVDT
jgi:hypothetical protein